MVLCDYQVDFTFNSLYEIGGKIYAGLSLFLSFNWTAETARTRLAAGGMEAVN